MRCGSKTATSPPWSTVLAIAGALGHDEIELEAALSSQPVKDRLKSEVDDAMTRGVFGSPYVIVEANLSGAPTGWGRSKNGCRRAAG